MHSVMRAGVEVLITAVEPGGPADEAGVERGMAIYRVAKSDVTSVQQVEALLASVPKRLGRRFRCRRNSCRRAKQ